MGGQVSFVSDEDIAETTRLEAERPVHPRGPSIPIQRAYRKEPWGGVGERHTEDFNTVLIFVTLGGRVLTRAIGLSALRRHLRAHRRGPLPPPGGAG